ncbi:MAG: cob(I)yrinic acid a,c-diamide adenosyltransferase [Candidatus Hatepunaea meridiana]|nr:cob(I)yrinic acid a,c-diamide adenosyltransferase [Candidatus Hatepunaea meridiana]
MKSYIQIYTGNGKGKTSAALGVALRAAGAGLQTLLIQFMKDGFPYSEMISLPLLSEFITVEKYGSDVHVLEKRQPTTEERLLVKQGLNRARLALTVGDYDVLILDEICVAVHFDFFTAEEVAKLFDLRPDNVELILTGRYCPKEWIERADLVTEMREVKHYFNKGVLSRKGIDC